MPQPHVGLVLVSHSAKLVEGLAELAAQMASDITIRTAGGLEDGGIGTSYDLIESAINDLLSQELGVVVLTDLGSATMTVESVLEFLEDDPVTFVDAPLVEAAIAAATSAQQGDDLAAVATAAAQAIDIFVASNSSRSATTDESTASATSETGESYKRTVTVADAAGLHARPASKVAEMAATADGDIVITYDGEDAEADSAMMLMSLGAPHGASVTVSGEAGDSALVDQIADGIAQGPDE